jgi:NAD(P)-dependent dehydrogenase (short-subunit alcohol dehydrogenase family)
MNRMRGKSAIVTGGAVGIGHACALKLAEEGAAVAVTDVDVNKGSAVVDEIRSRGGDAMFVEHNVADEAQWDRVMKLVAERYKKLDVLVNNAGVATAPKRATTFGSIRCTRAISGRRCGELPEISGRCRAGSQAVGQHASSRSRRGAR